MYRNIDQINNVIENINNMDNFIITSHVNPDGDNIGSSMAMYYFLSKIGKKVRYVLEDDYPQNLIFLLDKNIKRKSKDIQDRGQVIVALDAGDYSRICIDEDILSYSTDIICIDHHITNGDYSKIKYIDTEASSTCEMVYNLIKTYENIYEKNIIDKNIATYLYVGLVTDTGNFQYSNTESSSLIMAADLIDRGAEKDKIIQNVYQSNSINFYKILGEALSNLELIDEKISIITVTKDMMERNCIGYDDIDLITPYTRDIDGVELGIFIKEKSDEEVKVSLRSKNYVDCAKLAREFSGGGHIRAAGCTFYSKDIDQIKKMLIEKSIQYINSYTK